MHEYALAQAIVEGVRAIERAKKIRAERVLVRVGKMQAIDLDILKGALKTMANIDWVIKEEEVMLKCNDCALEFSPRLGEKEQENVHFVPELLFSYVRCPRCGSCDLDIVSGRGVWIEWIAGSKMAVGEKETEKSR